MAESKSFFMTGCASGIGKHLADVLIARGDRVFATDINIEALEAHAKEKNWPADRVHTSKLNVCDPEEWKRVFAEAVQAFGHLDVVMNIAGILKSSWVQDTPIKDVEMQVDINVKGVIYGTQEAARHMIPRKAGHIINIASMAGMAPIPGLAVYSGSKYAVRGFTMAAAGELRRYNIAVTAVCPDGVNTPLLDLPVENEAADLIWSGSRLLTVQDIEKLVLGRVLAKKPVVAALPWTRAIQARLGDLFPSVGFGLVASLAKKGHQKRQQQKMREQH